MRNGNWKMTTAYKMKVKNIILNHEKRAWNASCMLYEKLALYQVIVLDITMNLWWKLVSDVSGAFKSVSSVVAIICGSQPKGLGANFGRNARCQICTGYETETFEHTLFTCDTLTCVRNNCLDKLRQSMPIAMWLDFERMSISYKMKFLLSGLNSTNYMPEWKDILLCVSNFVFEL